ncbi:alpha/beta fold hydrolase [Frondihabitans australicus]|uniref:Sigma-B regulation protein RsbQ n=1 Tax=Frondihabitans australicus TaxID=386892 RepID=A0A495IL55_9MICO|nr:alpha/beta hydrolase [Frondihabitans australicus]RKR75865.1 sigma-B regulation protein RsbQ [Frondihabitans australicus]
MTSARRSSSASLPSSTHSAVVFVHGFAQTGQAWGPMIDVFGSANVRRVRPDMAGVGSQLDAAGPFTLERFADDLVDTIDAAGGPVSLIAHSMGAQVAELAATRRPSAVTSLVLLAPLPLGGLHASEEEAPVIDAEGLRATSLQVFSTLGALGRELATSARQIRADVLQQHCDAFAAGHSDGEQASAFTGPVLVIPGADDEIASPTFVATHIAPRFSRVAMAPIAGAGHHPHLEQPSATASAIASFATAGS